MIRSKNFDARYKDCKSILLQLFAADSGSSSYFYSEFLQHLLLQKWKTQAPWLYSLYTQHNDIFNESIGEVAFGLIEGED